MEVKKYKDMEDFKAKTTVSTMVGGDIHGFARTNLIGFKRVHPDAVIPHKADDGCTGYDLHSVADIEILPGKHAIVPTGLKWEASGYDMSIRPRSGLAAKHLVTVLNTPGSVDASYRGEIGVILINHGETTYKVSKGDRIAQAVFHKVDVVHIGELEELSDTVRGEGKMGSTGK